MDPRMQAQLDQAARQRGFKDYAQYSAWSARQAEMQGNPQVQAGPAPQQQAAPQNWLQQLLGAVNPMNYVANRVNPALSGKRR